MIRGIRPGALGALLVFMAGCIAASILMHPSSVAASANKAAMPDYAHVSRILETQCVSCHNPQGGAPFNLLTYEDAKQWGGQILDVTQSRYMPPWLPATGKGDFTGARRLSEADLATLRGWVGAGMPAGPATAPTKPSPSAEQWTLGKPDAVLSLAEPVKLAGNGPDVFTSLIVPVAVTEAKTLCAMQIRPSDPQAVRSVWVGFDPQGRLQKPDGWQQGIAGMEPPPGLEGSGPGLVFWLSGSPPLQPRAGEQWTVQPGSDLVLTTHLKTTGRKQELQMQVALYYAPAALSTGNALVLPLAHHGVIDLAAGASAVTVEDSYTLPQAAAVTAIYPRAHFLARSLDAYAMTPAGKQVPLLSIPRWDVDWLEVYCYRRPVQLPAGSVVHWKYVYDNTAENPHNPSDPPAAVHAGGGAKEEAADLMLELLPGTADAAEWRKTMLAARPK